MAEAIAELAGDPARAVRLGREGQEMVSERFSRARVEGLLAGLYQ